MYTDLQSVASPLRHRASLVGARRIGLAVLRVKPLFNHLRLNVTTSSLEAGGLIALPGKRLARRFNNRRSGRENPTQETEFSRENTLFLAALISIKRTDRA